MNKYQEALERVKIDFNDRVENDEVLLVGQIDIDNLQEIVDKETPKKVKVIDEPDLHYIYYCPSCGATLMVDRKKHPKHLFNYCGKCGQKLDWDI